MSRSTPNYIPRPDGDCAAWAAQFATACKDNQAALGLSGKERSDIQAAVDAFVNDLNANVAAQAAAESAAQTKNLSRTAMEQLLRSFTRIFQSAPTMTDALRAQLGITVPTGTLTPTPAPTTAPVLTVDLPARLTHTLRLTDSATPTRTAKPRGVLGAEVWFKLVTSPDREGAGSSPTLGDPSTFRFLSLATKPLARATFRPDEGGKTAVYMTRWVTTRGEKGPWSEIATATIAA